MFKATFILREGFWSGGAYEDSASYPKPVASDKSWKGRKVFMGSLKSVETNLKTTIVKVYKGYSTCRVCDLRNGCNEFQATALGVTWVWPEGFSHYVEAHNVRPSLAFQEFINAAASLKVVAVELTGKSKSKSKPEVSKEVLNSPKELPTEADHIMARRVWKSVNKGKLWAEVSTRKKNSLAEAERSQRMYSAICDVILKPSSK